MREYISYKTILRLRLIFIDAFTEHHKNYSGFRIHYSPSFVNSSEGAHGLDHAHGASVLPRMVVTLPVFWRGQLPFWNVWASALVIFRPPWVMTGWHLARMLGSGKMGFGVLWKIRLKCILYCKVLFSWKAGRHGRPPDRGVVKLFNKSLAKLKDSGPQHCVAVAWRVVGGGASCL